METDREGRPLGAKQLQKIRPPEIEALLEDLARSQHVEPVQDISLLQASESFEDKPFDEAIDQIKTRSFPKSPFEDE